MQFVFPWSEPDLTPWLARPIHPQAARDMVPNPHHDLTEAILGTESAGPPEACGSFLRVSESVLGYRIFGPKIGTPYVQTESLQVGDTVGLNYRFLPGLSLFFASRVVDVFALEETEDGWRSGFAYQTLTHHPELGEEVFEVCKRRDGRVTLRIEAWSRPNLWFVSLFAPLGRRIQRYAARCAVEYLTEVAQGRVHRT